MKDIKKTATVIESSKIDIDNEIRRIEAELPEGQYLEVLTDEERELLGLYDMLLAYQKFYVIHYLMHMTGTATDMSAALLPAVD